MTLTAQATSSPSFQSPASLHFVDAILSLQEDFQLDCGRVISQARIAYRLLGPPDAPVVGLLGGISASRCAWQPESAPDQGWWQNLIGPAHAFDSSRYRFLSFDYLGGNGESTSPRLQAPDVEDFPPISTRDQARLLERLMQALQLKQLESMIGASYGGMVALAFCEQFPEQVKRALIICAAHQAWPLASGWRHVQREVVRFALRHHEPATGLKLARALAVTTYRSGYEFAERFGPGPDGGCVDYLNYCGERFASRFDAQAYLCLSQSIDTHKIDPEKVSVPVDLIGFSSDQIVPPAQLEELYGFLAEPRRLALIPTLYGHDAFLKEDAVMTQEIKQHLETCK